MYNYYLQFWHFYSGTVLLQEYQGLDSRVLKAQARASSFPDGGLMDIKHTIVSLMDYTSLSGEETKAQLHAMAKEAHSPLGSVAAICVYPRFVSQVKDSLAQARLPQLAVASVVNFPHGELPLDEVIAEIHYALQQGADEIDLVIPHPRHRIYGAYRDFAAKLDFVQACRNETHAKILKLIIESGQLDSDEIKRCSKIGIEAGVDFIKTSTGKISAGATLEAAEIILQCIQAWGSSGAKRCGLKVSGGIRSLNDALPYLQLAAKVLGEDFLQPRTFRFGASGLLQALLEGGESQTTY